MELALGLNLSQFYELIISESPNQIDSRLILVDNYGTKIADSKSSATSNLESFEDLRSLEKAKSGEVGSMVKVIEGKDMTVSYAPINFAQSKWILLSVTPQK